jgi:hypothetical protein
MSLTIYDPEQNCQVLNPEEFKPIINAFHPDYVKTYMPEFLSTIRLEATQKANGQVNGAKAKASRESVNKSAFTISQFPKTQSVQRTLEKRLTKEQLDAKKKAMLDVKQYFTFSKAGVENVKPKGKKK